jgi:hypothetical protein
MANPFAYPSANLTSIEQLLPFVNTLTGGYFGTVILFLRMLNLINDGVLGFVTIAFVGIVIYMIFQRQQEY